MGECSRCGYKTERLFTIRFREVDSQETLDGNICAPCTNAVVTIRKPEASRTVSESGEGRVMARVQGLRQELCSFSNLLKRGVPPQRYAVEKILPIGGVTIFAAPPAGYKTMFALEVGSCVSGGRDFLEQFAVEKGTVLYIDEENGDVLLLNRLKAFGEELDEGFKRLSYPGLKLDRDEDVLALCRIVEEEKPVLIIIDSLVRFQAGEENRSDHSRILYEGLSDLMLANPCAILLLHHLRKDSAGRKYSGLDSLRGSGDFAGLAAAVFIFQPGGKNPVINVKCVKHRLLSLEDVPDFKVKVLSEDDRIGFEYAGLLERQPGREDRAKEGLLEWIKHDCLQSFCWSDALAKMKPLGHSKNAIEGGLRELASDGVVLKKGRGKFEVVAGGFGVEEVISQ